MLVLRARGVGATWTTIVFKYEKEVADLLRLPANMTPGALLPVAYFKGDDFKPPQRVPARERTHWNTWGSRRERRLASRSTRPPARIRSPAAGQRGGSPHGGLTGGDTPVPTFRLHDRGTSRRRTSPSPGPGLALRAPAADRRVLPDRRDSSGATVGAWEPLGLPGVTPQMS
jgi:hypothetical protein